MNISIYDRDLNRVAIIGSSFVSCFWSEGYNTVQDFTLELQETPELKKKIQEDYYVGRADRPTLMVIKTVQNKNRKIIATGKQAARVLDDVAFVGTLAAGGYIDSDIQRAYNQSNKYRQLSAETSSTFLERHNNQISNKSILELCKIMCAEADAGFRVVRKNGKMSLQFYKPPENPNLIFSEVFGNLIIESITRSTQALKNYAIVLGAGEGTARTKVVVDMTGGADRREIIIDAKDLQKDTGESDAQYQNRLRSRGVEKLLELTETRECAFSPVSQDFGSRFDLGDVLTVNMPDYGLKIKARLARFTQKEQNNKTVTTLDVGKITLLR